MLFKFEYFLGPEMPFGAVNGAIVPSPDEQAIYVVGGYDWFSGTNSDAIMKLECQFGPGSCEWTVLESKLSPPGYVHHLAFAVYGDFNCTLKN